MTREELIEKVKEVATRLGKTALTQREFYLETRVSDYWTGKHFEYWGNLCVAAGIEPKQPYNLTDDQVLVAMRDAFDRQGGIGTNKQLVRHFRYTHAVLRARWPDWVAALTAAITEKTNIRNMETNISADGEATIDLTLDVADKKHLERLVLAMRKVNGVRAVERIYKA